MRIEDREYNQITGFIYMVILLLQSAMINWALAVILVDGGEPSVWIRLLSMGVALAVFFCGALLMPDAFWRAIRNGR